jgi:hypothetical protein
MNLNNKKVDRWKKEVLSKIADHRSSIPSGRVAGSWKLFEEGTGIRKYMELKEKGVIPETSPEVLEFWKDFFENLTVEEMHEYGTGVVAFGWSIIQDHLKRWFCEKKWEVLFSQAPDDPLFWEKNYHTHTPYLEGKVLPFWNEEILKDIHQKVGTVLTIQVQPQGVSGVQAR